MENIETLRDFGQIKMLADPRRMEILCLLMREPATLTQLAQVLLQSPAWVRHHMLALQAAGLVELAEVRKREKVTEKYYQAKAGAFLLQQLVVPKTKKPARIFSGSNDLALESIAHHLGKHFHMLNFPIGSLDGLVYLRQGLCQFSGSHILDEDGDYNCSTVRHIFPDRSVELVTLAHRNQGLMVGPGNPKSIKKIKDIARLGVRFVNRNPGSGTRLWFDAELKRLKLDAKQIQGYERMVQTHHQAAAMIAAGRADVALGLQAAAFQHHLDFIPLFEERYDLVLPRENEEFISPLLDYLQTAAFRNELNSLTGYGSAHSGEQIFL
ncbi:MAG TPA: substrate-binding domain-containing protein [Anaerolineales bacterium]|nr:substrate-binding domain-containing protein [Anaerolineales bacterium]